VRWLSRRCGIGFRRTVNFAVCLLVVLSGARMAAGQSNAPQGKPDAMRELSASFEKLVQRVSPSVVEVLVTGYGAPDEDQAGASSALERERSLGSGVIVDPSGYIVTNYHVIRGGVRVRVVLSVPPSGDSQAMSLVRTRGRILPAQVVGFNRQIDIAVLKVEAAGLPALTFGRYMNVQKGQLVLAFGSPQGLENSVTLGVVSSVLRQPDPDAPMVYIQTDAAINPGNSGGPLIGADGDVLGINTFIYTKSGGNEGIGFAIPSGIVEYAYEQIRQNGRVPRRSIGAGLQTLTPDLAAALRLPVQSGVIVSDVYPESPAERAGLKRNDVIVGVGGVEVDNVPLFVLSLYLLTSGDTVDLDILRDGKKMSLRAPVYDPKNDLDKLSDLGDPQKGLISGLGIVGTTVTPAIEEILGTLRIPSGVLVTSLVANRLAVDSGLQTGDIIHSLNQIQVSDLETLQSALGKLVPGQSAAMLVERNGNLSYVVFEME